MRIIQVLIDRPGGVDIEVTSIINQEISEQLDIIDPIEEQYFLEVASVGLEKELKSAEEIESAIGKYVRVETVEKVTVGKINLDVFEGFLLSVESDSIVVNVKVKQFRKEVKILKELVKFIRLALEFESYQK